MKPINMKPGETHFSRAPEPIIEVVGGSKPYLWIGNESGQAQGFCFATLEGVRLKMLRDEITKALRARKAGLAHE